MRHTNSPSIPAGTDAPSPSTTSTARPSAGTWISPACTGNIGLPITRQPQRSVPPEIDARWRSDLIASYTNRNPSGDSVEPVEANVRTVPRSWVSVGRIPAFAHASRNFADVPKKVTPTSSARSKSRFASGYVGAPSNSTSVAPVASPDASQFHIIQPAVVK